MMIADKRGALVMRKIWLAGGCFWGVEGYFQQLKGVLDTTVGYGQGRTADPTYKEVCSGLTGHTEICEVAYDETVLPLTRVLEHFFRIIDPTTLNRQGADRGTQYRSGIYYTEEEDQAIILQALQKVGQEYTLPLVVEVQRLSSFYPAEDYHQDYLRKNPGGYCHVDMDLAAKDERKTPEGV